MAYSFIVHQLVCLVFVNYSLIMNWNLDVTENLAYLLWFNVKNSHFYISEKRIKGN